MSSLSAAAFNRLSVKHKFVLFVVLLVAIGGLLATTVVAPLSPFGKVFDSYVDENSQ